LYFFLDYEKDFFGVVWRGLVGELRIFDIGVALVF
jgi:hypothetical protein